MRLMFKYKLWRHKRRRRALRRSIENFQDTVTFLKEQTLHYGDYWKICADAHTKAGLLLDTFKLREEV